MREHLFLRDHKTIRIVSTYPYSSTVKLHNCWRYPDSDSVHRRVERSQIYDQARAGSKRIPARTSSERYILDFREDQRKRWYLTQSQANVKFTTVEVTGYKRNCTFVLLSQFTGVRGSPRTFHQQFSSSSYNAFSTNIWNRHLSTPGYQPVGHTFRRCYLYIRKRRSFSSSTSSISNKYYLYTILLGVPSNGEYPRTYRRVVHASYSGEPSSK